MVHVKIKGRLEGVRKYKKRKLPYKESYNAGFVKVENPGKLYVAKLEAFYSVYNRNAWGFYIKGDGTLKGADLRIKEFATQQEANDFLNHVKGSPLLEKIKIKLFGHKEDHIYYTPDDFITSEYYYELYPQLRKYHYRKTAGEELDWFLFLKNLGLKQEENYEGC